MKLKIKNLKDKKIALYGGSFNPIHQGHLQTGLDLYEKLNFDYILFVPNFRPVHKKSIDFPRPRHRYNMVNIAIKGYPYFLSTNLEINRGGDSFTIDTINELKEKYQLKHKLNVIIGSDLLPGLHKWKHIDQIYRTADIICLRRQAEQLPVLKTIHYFDNRIIEISSTEIRNRIKANLPIDFMVTNGVKKYIQKKHLYE